MAIRKSSKKALKSLLVFLSIFSLTTSQIAYAGRGGLIRDAETEQLIRSYARPILKAAGLAGQNIKIHLVNNASFNAFVVDGQNMFIHVGAIIQSKTPNQLIGVIAHETGHITGGHLARLRSQMKKAQSASMMLQILGIAAMIGGAFAGGNGGNIGRAGQGLAGGGSNMIRRHVLAGRRIEEASADQAAIKFLNRTGQSGVGMLKTFEFFADQGLAGSQFVDPYVLSHPMPQNRIANLRVLVNKSPYKTKKDSKNLQLRHDLVRAKLVAHTTTARNTVRKYSRKNKNTLPALYAKAIAAYKQSGVKSFLPKINQLIRKQPNNPFFHETKGEFLFKSGLPLDAIPSLRKAVRLSPRSDLIRITLAQALIATNQKSKMNEAIKLLRKALVRESQASTGYRQLAIAYGRQNKISQAELATAQAYFYEGRLADAKRHARKAKKMFKRGTSYWVRADDIASFTPPRRR